MSPESIKDVLDQMRTGKDEPPNNGVQLTCRAGEIVDNESIAGGSCSPPDR